MYKKVIDENEQILGIFRESDNAQIPMVMDNRDYKEFSNWLAKQSKTVDELEAYNPITLEQRKLEYGRVLTKHMDLKAQEKDYDSALSLSTYSMSTNMDYKNEATVFLKWRDDCWAYAYDVLGKVERNEIPLPNKKEFINNAPQFNWS